jgi:hypothetical protein
VQIAALLHIHGIDMAKGRRGIASLLVKILGLEYGHWDRALRIAQQPNWQIAMKNGVAQLAMLTTGSRRKR